MRICWDNLEGLRYSRKTDKWYKGSSTYIYKEACKNCGEPFLSLNGSIYCSRKCSNASMCGKKGKEHPAYGYRHTDEAKRRISVSHEGENNPMWGKKGKEHPNYGYKHTDETKRKISDINKEIFSDPEKHPSWKGGYASRNVPMYVTYAPQLEWCEEVRRNEEDPNVLEVRCTKCGKWYVPVLSRVRGRLQALKGQGPGEQNFYCSPECKDSCSIYGRSANQLMKEDAIKAGRLPWLELSREVQPELRKLVLERDGYQCVKCGSKGPLQCHHIYPVATNPLESADIDNCLTLCYTCHMEVHQKDGCKYGQLEIKVC